MSRELDLRIDFTEFTGVVELAFEILDLALEFIVDFFQNDV